MVTSDHSFYLGERVQDQSGFRGTVRYVGPVHTSKKPDILWIGVEFDDPCRGKHNGTVKDANGNAIQYFECRNYGSGSFLKKSKIIKGISLAAAIEKNYVNLNAPLIAPHNILSGQYVQTIRGSFKNIELYGEEKIRKRQQISELKICTLRSSCISKCVEEGDEKDTETLRAAKDIELLDLKDNLLFDWKEVFQMCELFPKLSSLAISGNKMKPIESCSLDKKYPQLKSLIIHSVGIQTRTEVFDLISFFPNLEELYMSENSIEYFCNGLDTNILLMMRNLLISCLSHLKKLTSLNLSGNFIDSIEQFSERCFLSLESLQIYGSNISSWLSINNLSSITSLQSLRFGLCPLTAQLTMQEVRTNIIARLPKISKINGSIVSDRERTDAEIAYIQLVQREIKDLNSDSDIGKKISIEHPQYEKLLSQQNDISAISFNERKKLSDTLIEVDCNQLVVHLVLIEGSESICGYKKQFRKKIPSTLRIRQLKVMCSKLFNVDIDSKAIFIHHTIEGEEVKTPLDNELKSIDFYSLKEGSKITVESSH